MTYPPRNPVSFLQFAARITETERKKYFVNLASQTRQTRRGRINIHTRPCSRENTLRGSQHFDHSLPHRPVLAFWESADSPLPFRTVSSTWR